MDCFEILGIEKSKDVKEIRKAYSRMLSKYSPEKDPEGFQRLRAAYEEALDKVKEEEPKENILSPIDRFIKDFEENYRDFSRRIDLTSWQSLLEREVCFNIDTSKEVGFRILDFIMDNYNFPTEIWRLFNNHFSWTSKKEVLCRSYPKNFIDFLVYKIDTDSTFNYKFLKQCKENEQDKFIEEFRNLGNAIDNLNYYAASKAIKETESICTEHPGLKVMKARYMSMSGRIEKALEIYAEVLAANENDVDALFYRGELYFTLGRVAEAIEDYKKVLEVRPSSAGVWYTLAKCFICTGSFEEAVKYSEQYIDAFPYAGDARVMLTSAYSFFIDNIEEREGIASTEERFKLAEAYFKISKTEESYNTLKELMQSTEAASDMYRLLCRIYISQRNIELAYSTINKAVELFKEDYELNFIKADILDELGQYEESVEQYDRAISLNKDIPSAYNNKAFVLNKVMRFDEALSCINTAIELEPEAAHSYKNKAAALLGLKMYEDCLEACQTALHKYQYLTEAYVIKMKALNSIGQYEDSMMTYKAAIDLGLRDSQLHYEKAKACRAVDRYEEAMKLLNQAIEIEEGNADFYYEKGLCYYDRKQFKDAIDAFEASVERKKDFGAAYYYKAQAYLALSEEEAVLNIIDAAISLNLENLDNFYALKGSILEDRKMHGEAFLLYKKAIECAPDIESYYYSAGHNLSDLKKFEEAIAYYNKYIEINPHTREPYVNISYCLYNLKKYEECIEYCNRALEIDPDYSVAHQNKGWSLYNLKNIEEAEKECAIALKLNGNNTDILLLKLRLLNYKGLYQEALAVCHRMLDIDPKDNNTLNIKRELIDKIEAAGKKKGLFKSIFR